MLDALACPVTDLRLLPRMCQSNTLRHFLLAVLFEQPNESVLLRAGQSAVQENFHPNHQTGLAQDLGRSRDTVAEYRVASV